MIVLELARKYHDDVVKLRREFHQHPELSWKEYRTSARIKEELEKMGIPYITVGETGVLATIEGTSQGKTIALRADIDALSLQELNTIEYASCNPGVMHACGHDGHTASLLGAARILMELRQDLKGTVKLFFEPAEEVGGSIYMFEEKGLLDGMDGCFAIHVKSDISVGMISIEPGPRMASADFFFMKVSGKGGHGSTPHLGIDAVVAASAIVMNLQTIVSREINPLEPAVVSIGKISAGTKFNIIADEALIEGTLRTFNPKIRADFKDIINRIASHTAAAFRAKAEITQYIYGPPPVINPIKETENVRKTAAKLFGEQCFQTTEKWMGGEDFGRFMEIVPGALAFVGVGNSEKGSNFMHHHGNFNMDEDGLTLSVALYAQYALDFLAEYSITN